MKKNLAKRIVLGLLTGAVFMSSSVAWAADLTIGTHTGTNSILITMESGHAYMDNSIFIGNNGGVGQMNGNVITPNSGNYGVAIGEKAKVIADGGVALGADTTVSKVGSVALGYGSVASESYVVSVGSGNANDDYATRKIINVTAGENANDAVNVGQLNAVKTALDTLSTNIGTVSELASSSNYAIGTSLVGAVSALDNMVKTNYNAIDVVEDKIGNFNTFDSVGLIKDATSLSHVAYLLGNAIEKTQKVINNGTITVNNVEGAKNPVTIDSEGITVGTNSARIDGSGFYVWDSSTTGHINSEAIASMTEDGKIKGAGGKFEVGTDGQLKAANGKFEVDDKGNVTAESVTAGNLYTKDEIDQKLGGSNASISGINQRLEKTNAKINKVGAGAAALAALHPLDYDPDDKLTFSAGMGNYAGENAAALGAFYRPNEKFMVSLGGTMGNGENMVNLGLSIGLDKPNGFAKMSKRELIQEVNAVKAENEAMKDQLANADERIAKLEALVAQLVAK